MKFFLILISLISLVLCRDTPRQKAQRLELATESDKHINFISHSDLTSTLKNGTLVIFYGAVWCKFTQKFTPKYLSVQNRISNLKINPTVLFRMRKVECSTDELFCTEKHGLAGFPSMVLYQNGLKIEEYPFADEEEEFYDYVKGVIERLNAMVPLPVSAVKAVVSIPVAKKGMDTGKVVSFGGIGLVVFLFIGYCIYKSASKNRYQAETLYERL